LDINTVEDHLQLAGCQFQADGVGRREVEAALLKALVPQAQAVAVPVQHLEPIRPTIEEDKQMARERVTAQLRADQGGEAVKAAAQIGRGGGAPDAHGGRQGQHSDTPSTSRRSRTQASSEPGERRSTQPDGSSTSTGAVAGGTTRTGRKRGEPLPKRRRQA